MNTIILLYLIGSVLTFIFTVGTYFAYFQRVFPLIAKDDVKNDIENAYLCAAYASLASWFGLITVFLLSSCLKHGWKFPTTKGAT